MTYHIFIYKETCFVAPVERYEREGDTSYEQASNSNQEQQQSTVIERSMRQPANQSLKITCRKVMI